MVLVLIHKWSWVLSGLGVDRAISVLVLLLAVLTASLVQTNFNFVNPLMSLLELRVAVVQKNPKKRFSFLLRKRCTSLWLPNTANLTFLLTGNVRNAISLTVAEISVCGGDTWYNQQWQFGPAMHSLWPYQSSNP